MQYLKYDYTKNENSRAPHLSRLWDMNDESWDDITLTQ